MCHASPHSLVHDADGAVLDSVQQAAQAQADVEYVVEEGEHRLALGRQEDVVQEPVLVAAVARDQLVQVAGRLLIGHREHRNATLAVVNFRRQGDEGVWHSVTYTEKASLLADRQLGCAVRQEIEIA